MLTTSSGFLDQTFKETAMMPALKQQYDWDDTPREHVYQARKEYAAKLKGGKNPLPQKAFDEFMAEWDRENGI